MCRRLIWRLWFSAFLAFCRPDLGVVRETPWREALSWTVPALALDALVRRWAPGENSSPVSKFLRHAEKFGESEGAWLWLATAAYAWSRGDREWVCRSAMEFAWKAGVLVPALKRLSGRSRPADEESPLAWRPMGGADSVPSGHVIFAFTLAETLSAYSRERAYDDLLWLAAGLTAISRLYHRKHWLSDVVFSAALVLGHRPGGPSFVGTPRGFLVSLQF